MDGSLRHFGSIFVQVEYYIKVADVMYALSATK